MKNTTYTKISEFTTIITEKISRNRINVFTVYMTPMKHSAQCRNFSPPTPMRKMK